MDLVTAGIGVVLGLIVGATAAFLIARASQNASLNNARRTSESILREARKEAEAIKASIIAEGHERLTEREEKIEEELRERRQEIVALEKKLAKREEQLDKRSENVEVLEADLHRRLQEAQKCATQLETREKELHQLIEQQKQALENVAHMTEEQAREQLLSTLERQLQREQAIVIKRITEETRELANKKAREIVTTAIERIASEHVGEVTVSTVPIASDELKGRIIGREGRNIRAFEQITGINLIVDDTPEAVVLSGFDPVRREIARQTLEKLIQDGRIHPGRIEELYNKILQEMEETLKEEGSRAAFECGVHDLKPELIRLLGRLRFRYSYGQNVLYHSKETAHLTAIMAAELGCDVNIARRAGLLHDIGKAVDYEIDGPHALIGADIAKRNGESQAVCNAIAAHHNDVDKLTLEAVLVQAADALSAARPGVRRETMETYIKRLEQLEKLCESFSGVERCYAIQAGREVRVLVQPDKIDDAMAAKLARDIRTRIEDEMQYPGQIRVTVIREVRATEIAR